MLTAGCVKVSECKGLEVVDLFNYRYLHDMELLNLCYLYTANVMQSAELTKTIHKVCVIYIFIMVVKCV
jgi:hypothetical protein